MNIAISLNSLYMRYAYVMLTSLYTNNTTEKITVFALENDLTDADKHDLSSLTQEYNNQIQFLHVDKNNFSDQLSTNAKWTIETYFRLMLPDIMPPDIERILYIDIDIIITKNISAFYHTDFDQKLFCVCQDMDTFLPNFQTTFPTGDIRTTLFKDYLAQDMVYFNAGIMIWNLAALRNQYSLTFYMDLAKELNYSMWGGDQDLLNYAHWNQVKYVDTFRYNFFSQYVLEDISPEKHDPPISILHYTGVKPWCYSHDCHYAQKIWWEYAALTPFYTELLAEHLESFLKNAPNTLNSINSLREENEQLNHTLMQTTLAYQTLYDQVKEYLP